VTTTASVSDVEAAPPKESRVYRVRARTEQRERGAERGEQKVNPRIARLQDEASELENRDERSGHRCPEPDEEKDPQTDLEESHWSKRRVSGQSDCRAIGQRRARYQPHHQQPRAWQAGGERGKETPQKEPLINVTEFWIRGKDPEECGGNPLESLEFEELRI